MKRNFIFTKKQALSVGNFLLLAAVFSLIYPQLPLYYSNQNQYFLHGLANGGLGLLKPDWLANTVDPSPVFSLLVMITYRFFSENLFYVYYTIILGVYLYGLIGIVAPIFKIDSSRSKYLTFLALILIIHSSVFSSLSTRILGINLSQLLHWGVAEQYILGLIFQPSVLGVFLILSINVFLRGKPYLAVFLLIVSATFHPTYLLSAAILTLAYMLVTLKEEKSIVKSSIIGLLSLILVLPILGYVYISFSPTSPELLHQSQDILANFRIPHHIISSTWSLGIPFYVRLLIIVLALVLVRKTKLFLVLFISFSAAVFLTMVQMISGSHYLALLFPWRLSVFLVPISTSIVVAHIVSYCYARYSRNISNKHRLLEVISYTIISLLIVTGLYTKSVHFDSDKKDFYSLMLNYIRDTRSPGDTYLVPIRPLYEIENFRLYTGAPIFIDYKSIPYKDIEVIEWYNRIKMARDFYANDTIDYKLLEKFARNYGITHFVSESGQFKVERNDLNKVYSDDYYEIYKIKIR